MIEKEFLGERINNVEKGRSDIQNELQLRPKSVDEFIGQKLIINNINLMTKSALLRGQALDHILLAGPPGLGKTSLAMIIADSIGSHLHVLSAPALDKKGDLASILTNLESKDVLFIDEIHRLHIGIEELLYSAMEDFRLDILIGQGPSARSMQIDLPRFTLIGATTRSGLLSAPLRDRFMAHMHFEFYNLDEMVQIVDRNALIMSLDLSNKAKLLLAQCCRSTPRILNRILRRLRDYVVVNKISKITEDEVRCSLELLDIDSMGLDSMDRKILDVIQTCYKGGPVGIDSLCATLSEERVTLEEVYEPYLLMKGLIQRTARGRVVTDLAKTHLSLFRNKDLK